MKRTTEPRRHGGGRNIDLTQGDLHLIETIKRERPTLSLREIYDGLTEFGDIPKGTSRSTISCALNNNEALLGGGGGSLCSPSEF